MACCMFWALFQLRVFTLMEMRPMGYTTPKSLSFNARYVARLCPPLVLRKCIDRLSDELNH